MQASGIKKIALKVKKHKFLFFHLPTDKKLWSLKIAK